MHWCAAHDVSGQVINRLLGPNHSYKPLWPEDLKVYLDLPVPASVAADLGWNVLSIQILLLPIVVPSKQRRKLLKKSSMMIPPLRSTYQITWWTNWQNLGMVIIPRSQQLLLPGDIATPPPPRWPHQRSSCCAFNQCG
jgi:hypothetical protein